MYTLISSRTANSRLEAGIAGAVLRAVEAAPVCDGRDDRERRRDEAE